MFCLSVQLEKQVSCCSINMQYLKPVGRVGRMNGIICMITAMKQSKQVEKKILRKSR